MFELGGGKIIYVHGGCCVPIFGMLLSSNFYSKMSPFLSSSSLYDFESHKGLCTLHYLINKNKSIGLLSTILGVILYIFSFILVILAYSFHLRKPWL